MILIKNALAAVCSASFFEVPVASINFDSFNLTATLKLGLWLGPVLETNLYIGRVLNFFNEYSCNLVFESIIVILDDLINSFHILRINFSAKSNPLSK